MLNQQLEKILSLFVLLSAAINSIAAMSCVDQKPVKNFDRSRYGGLWSLHGRGAGQLGSMACVKYLLSVADDESDDTFPIVALCLDDSDNSQHMMLKNGTLDENGEGVGLMNQQFTVMDTDYDKYAVIFACDEAQDELLVWALTREKEPSFDALIGMSYILNKYEIFDDDLDYTRPDSCPDDWSDAEVDEVDFSYESIEEELQSNGLVSA